MSRAVISVANLAKEYFIGGREAGIDSFREMIVSVAAAPFQRLKHFGGKAAPGESIWALKDVNFDVQIGEVVGIIGSNGAGKSTLLKILSRITEPTTGRVTIRGRVSSLLEVGTGFHPELTGRENIYLNGAILGMSRSEIDTKFDEIVDFSGVQKFIDTPIKRYSSGMSVRLAFAIAAHLEPEILIVDEVLAVGDAEFQKRCLGKLKDVGRGGRTVVFVSHNLGAVVELCSRCLLFDGGRLTLSASPSEVVAYYLSRTSLPQTKTYNNSYFEVERFCLIDDSGNSTLTFRKNSSIGVLLSVVVKRSSPSLHIGYALSSVDDRPLWWSFFGDASGIIGLEKGKHTLTTSIPGFWLNDGNYNLEIIAALHGEQWILPPNNGNVVSRFSVAGGSLGSALISTTSRPTPLMPIFVWQIEK